MTSRTGGPWHTSIHARELKFGTQVKNHISWRSMMSRMSPSSKVSQSSSWYLEVCYKLLLFDLIVRGGRGYFHVFCQRMKILPCILACCQKAGEFLLACFLQLKRWHKWNAWFLGFFQIFHGFFWIIQEKMGMHSIRCSRTCPQISLNLVFTKEN